ncbi:MAG TPA: hypothetical protein VK629_19550 [Steroidobacteraceae bacterium]|nr:hypothetical protein [Steroidobacteraceae bacterium]
MSKPASKPVPFATPDLSRLLVRKVPGAPKETLKLKLTEWMQEVVKAVPHQPGKKGAKYLVGTASGIDDLVEAPSQAAGMKLPAKGLGPTIEVHAKFTLAGAKDGRSHVERVWFSLSPDAQSALAKQRQAALKLQLLAEAEAKYRLSPKARIFPAEKYRDTWQEDIRKGSKIIDTIIGVAYEMAQELATIPENIVSPKDLGMTVGGAGVAKIGGSAEKVWNAGEKVIGGIEKASQFQDMANPEPKRKLDEGVSGFLQGQKSSGDVWLESALDKAADLPAVGRFVKLFTGFAFMVGSANFAKEVVTLRGRAYSFFIAGFIGGVTGEIMSKPPGATWDERFYAKGMKMGKFSNETSRFQAQAFLMYYSLTHYVVGETDAGMKRKHPQGSDFPSDYLNHWSPYTLGASLATMLKRKQYLLD